MLKPIDTAPTSAAPRLAASMIPGPPPVAMTLCRDWPGSERGDSSPGSVLATAGVSRGSSTVWARMEVSRLARQRGRDAGDGGLDADQGDPWPARLSWPCDGGPRAPHPLQGDDRGNGAR